MASSVDSASAVNVNVATGSGTSTFVAASGSNRAIVALCSHEQSNTTRPLPSFSANSVSFSNIGTFNAGASGSFPYNEAWICFEADIASVGSNPGISIGTPSGGNANVAVTLVTVLDCSQTLADWQAFFAHDNDLVTAAMSASLSGFTSGSAILGCACDGAGGFSIATNLGDTVTEFTGSDRNHPSGSRSVAYYGTAASTTPTVGVDSGATGTNYQSMILIGAPDAATGPTISSLGDSTPNYHGSTTIAGTGFPLSQTGSAAAALGGVAQSVTWNTDISCSIASIARGNLAYGNYNLVVTDAAGNASANYATSLSPQAGWKYITTSGTLADPSLRLTTTPVDIVSGNQISVGNVVGGTIDDITLYVDGSYSCAASVISFDYEVHDGTEWGAVGTEYPSTPAGRRGLIRSLARPLARSLVEALTN